MLFVEFQFDKIALICGFCSVLWFVPRRCSYRTLFWTEI